MQHGRAGNGRIYASQSVISAYSTILTLGGGCFARFRSSAASHKAAKFIGRPLFVHMLCSILPRLGALASISAPLFAGRPSAIASGAELDISGSACTCARLVKDIGSGQVSTGPDLLGHAAKRNPAVETSSDVVER